MQFHKQIDFKNTRHQAGIFFAQLAIQSPFILSAECKYSGVQHGWTECEHNMSSYTPTFNSPAVQLL